MGLEERDGWRSRTGRGIAGGGGLKERDSWWRRTGRKGWLVEEDWKRGMAGGGGELVM